MTPHPWAQTLRAAREAAHLTLPQLARRAGLSASTLKNFESGRRLPSRSSLHLLLGVPELRLHGLSPQDPDPAFVPNCWLAPEFDPIKMARELERQLNGRGGHLDQTHLYLDPLSAACWCALAEEEGYLAARAEMPLDRAALQARRCAGTAGLDVIGLGSGDGKDEVRLVHLLARQGDLDGTGARDLRLYLLDISQPLLGAAYRHADSLLTPYGVTVFAIQGDFHNLSRYTQLLWSPERSHRRRLVCLFGNTMANLQNEILFVRNSLIGFAPGDLLLLNVPLVCAPADQPEEVLRKDPRLSGRLPESLSGIQGRYEEWLTGPIRRYCKGVQEVKLSTHLDTASCPVPGSYAAEVRATVRLQGGEEKSFSLIYLKRYDVLKLVECMRQQGWAPVDGWQYAEAHHPRVLYLFQKQG